MSSTAALTYATFSMPPTLTILYRELCFLGSLHSRRRVLDSTLSLRSSQNTKPRLEQALSLTRRIKVLKQVLERTVDLGM